MSFPRLTLPLLFLLLPFAAGCTDRAPATDADAAIATTVPVAAATEPPPTVPASDDAVPDQPARLPDVIYVPTPQPVVDAMLNLAQVKSGDVLYDLGSGDGRIPVTAITVRA